MFSSAPTSNFLAKLRRVVGEQNQQATQQNYDLMHFSAVIKIGETVWPRQRIYDLSNFKLTLQNGDVSSPYNDTRRVRMLVISERSPETLGTFSSAANAAAYDEILLGTQSDNFALVRSDDKGGRGRADTHGAQLGKQAAANVRHQQAILARIDELLESPVYIDETKVCFDCLVFLQKLACAFLFSLSAAIGSLLI